MTLSQWHKISLLAWQSMLKIEFHATQFEGNLKNNQLRHIRIKFQNNCLFRLYPSSIGKAVIQLDAHCSWFRLLRHCVSVSWNRNIESSSCNSNSCNSKNHLDRTNWLVPSEFSIKLLHQDSYNSNSHNSKTHLNRSVWWVPSAIFGHVIRISAKKMFHRVLF